MAQKYEAPNSPPPNYGQQQHYDAGPANPQYPQQAYQHPNSNAPGGYGNPAESQDRGFFGGSPAPQQQGYYGPPQGQGYYGQPQPGYYQQQPMYYQQQPGGYYDDRRGHGGDVATGLCAGLCAGLCCLDLCLIF